MSSQTWKLEKDLCRCCHSEGSFKNLAEPSETTDLFEIYADMLNECFSIDMAPVPGLLSAATYTICEVCVIRLRDAADFKKQVLICEERFRDLYNRNGIKMGAPTIDIEVKVKEEIPDSEPEDVLKVELTQDDNAQNDDDFSIDSLSDIKMSDDEEEVKPPKVKVVKKKKIQAKKTVKCKTSKKTKQKAKTEPGAEDKEAEKKKQGRVVGRKPSRRIIIDEDYKFVGENIYHCVRCDKICRKYDTMRRHVKTAHYKILRFKCSICMEGFETLARLVAHKLEVHNVDERVNCSLCNKFFNTEDLLKRHIRNFHMLGEEGKRYKCEFCDYETFQGTAMSKHKYKHKTVKNHHCKFCKKSFMRKSTLQLHEKIHTGDRRKVCNECGQAFVQKASLNYHMAKHHPGIKF